MAKVYCICGKLCCGKSTYAKKLSEETRAPILSCDDLTLAIFDEQLGDSHERVTQKAQAYLYQMAVQLAELGISVILEWGFWTRESRLAANKFFQEKGIPVEWHYVEVSEEMWRRNIAKRNASGAAGSYYVDEGLAEKCSSLFEAPHPEEIDVWYQNEMKK